jgi:hypothetical protein
MPDAGSLQNILSQGTNASISADAINFQSSAASTFTVTPLQQLFQKFTAGSATTVTIDSAYNIVNSIPNAFLGQTFQFSMFSSGAGTVATPTLSDTAVTLVGTTSIVAGNVRQYQGLITQLSTTAGLATTSGTTFTSIAQVGTTNNYTVTLVTNANIPVVGNVIFINVTAGTLPAGWYPINKVTSATSFVIAAPNSASAWTATAATIPGTAVVPASQFTPNYPGVFSPLVTITAMQAYAAVV